jgi:hypothetical protein
MSEEKMDKRKEAELLQEVDNLVKDMVVPRAGDPDSLKKVVRSDQDFHRTLKAVEDAIWKSFGEDVLKERAKLIITPSSNALRPSLAEAKRRFLICEAWLIQARYDLGYSLEQSLDLIPRVLRAKLDGEDFEPEKPGERCWSPT